MEILDVKTSSGPQVMEGDKISLLYRVALSKDDFERGEFLETTYVPDLLVEVVVTKESLLEGVYGALVGMHSGGSIRRALITSSEAFGNRGYGPVPANSDLYLELCVARIIERRVMDDDVEQ